MRTLSLKKKVWITIVISFCFVMVGAGLLSYYLYERFYMDEQIAQLTNQGEELARVYQDYAADTYFLQRLQWVEQSQEVNTFYSDDPMVLGSGTPSDPDIAQHLITYDERQRLLAGENVVMVREHPRYNQDILGVAIPLLDGEELEGAILLSMPLEQVYAPFWEIRYPLLFVFVTAVLLIFYFGRKAAKNVTEPLKEMEVTAKKMAAGDFSARISNTGTQDELAQLARSFHTLSASLQAEDEKRREFLANVSHELRTPLSYMKGYTESMTDGMIDQKKGIRTIRQEAERMEHLVNDLLDLAQLEGDSYPMEFEPIALAQLVHDACDRYQIIAAQKGVEIIRKLDDQAIVRGDGRRLEQVVHNLLDNAFQYTSPNTRVEVTLEQKDQGSYELQITDEGPGIPAADLPFVKERFYRVNKARTREDGGTGLGLAIVDRIMQKHGGEFEIESTLGTGTTARIVLPEFT